MVVHTYNPSTQEAKAEGSRVLGQPGLHSHILFEIIVIMIIININI
jgi:hypothetical protein